MRRIRADDGPRLKAIRLAALREAPSAFAATHADAAAQPDDHWTDRAALGAAGTQTATFFAIADTSVVGLVGGYRLDPTASTVELVSMWVAPGHRRSGIAHRLIDAVVEWSRTGGATTVGLWVTAGNDAAQRLYEAAGFRLTGERQPLPSDPDHEELRMQRTLA